MKTNLINELRKNFINYQTRQNNLTQREANLAWEFHKDNYLDQVEEEIARILQDLS